MAPIQLFNEPSLQTICDILGDTSTGLTGSEIAQLLAGCGIADPYSTSTKRIRLFEALNDQQKRDRCGNHVVAFIQQAMNPVRYVKAPDVFDARRSQLNQALAFVGYYLGENGRLSKVTVAQTLSEAQQRAKQLRQELVARQVHHDVLRFCQPELLQDNYFHAVFEATKSVADKIRDMSSLQLDGSELVDRAFGGQQPILAFNRLITSTERSEQTGLMNLIKGLFGTFRNTTAHEPKIKWSIGQQDALDILSLASLLHRRLDASVKTGFD